MLCWVYHEKRFITSGPDISIFVLARSKNAGIRKLMCELLLYKFVWGGVFVGPILVSLKFGIRSSRNRCAYAVIIMHFFLIFFFLRNTQLAFYVNLHRAVIGSSATLTGRWRPDIDLRRMLTGYWAQTCFFENRVPLKLVSAGHMMPCILHCCHMNRSLKPILQISLFHVFFISNGTLDRFYLTTATRVKCHVAVWRQ